MWPAVFLLVNGIVFTTLISFKSHKFTYDIYGETQESDAMLLSCRDRNIDLSPRLGAKMDWPGNVGVGALFNDCFLHFP